MLKLFQYPIGNYMKLEELNKSLSRIDSESDFTPTAKRSRPQQFRSPRQTNPQSRVDKLKNSFERYEELKSQGHEILSNRSGYLFLVLEKTKDHDKTGHYKVQCGFPNGMIRIRKLDKLVPANDYQIGIMEGTITP